MNLFRDSNGEPIEIGSHLQIGAGGEARIYALPDSEELVAKVYHRPTEGQASKLIQMLAEPPVDPTAGQGHASIAWPIDLLRDEAQSGRIVGYLMPRANNARPILDYYNPAARRVACPLFSYRYLLRTARNLAAVVAVLHARDYVIGDVNEANILVTATALVTVVDTDSFQVRDATGQTVYRCPVARPEFTPAELQGHSLNDVDRTPEHDRFGLAVLLFQLLMEGTHPFAGVYLGEGDPPPYEARIAAGQFPYGSRPTLFRPLPLAPGIGLLPAQLQQLFWRCFQDGHDDPSARPDAQSWVQALRTAEENLATCNINPQHQYGRHLEECPWCARTLRLGGRDPFPARAVVETGHHLLPGTPVQSALPTAASVHFDPVSPAMQAGGVQAGAGNPPAAVIATATSPNSLSGPAIRETTEVRTGSRVVHMGVQSRSAGGRRPATATNRRLPMIGVLAAILLVAFVLVRAGLAARPGSTTGHTLTSQPVQPTQPIVATTPAPTDLDVNAPQQLQRAILAGDEPRVKTLLAADPPLARATGKKGWTPLHYAAYAGKDSIASLLCTAGANVNATTTDGSTPLHLAAQEGHAAVARTLLTHGADVNAQETKGWTPLHFAAQEGHADVATVLLDSGANVNSREHTGLTPLAVAVKEKMASVANLLRHHGGQT